MEQLEKQRFQVMHTVYLFRWFQHNMDFALLNRNHYCNVDDFSYFEYFRWLLCLGDSLLYLQRPEDLWAIHSQPVSPKPHKRLNSSWIAIEKVCYDCSLIDCDTSSTRQTAMSQIALGFFFPIMLKGLGQKKVKSWTILHLHTSLHGFSSIFSYCNVLHN